jgi:hypothetical protein
MFILQDYIILWIDTSLKDKIDICDTSTGLTAESHGFNSDVTKKELLNNFLSEFIDTNREDLINEIYVDILKLTTNTSYYDRVEELCYFNLNMQGEPYDNYWVYMLLNKL